MTAIPEPTTTAPWRTVCFVGDSITETGRFDDPEGLGSGYVRVLAEGPLAGAEVRNVGVGGDRIGHLAARWERDVLSRPADLVSVYVGINDSWRFFDSGIRTDVEDFAAGYARLLEPLVERGTALVLVEPFVVPVTPDQEGWAVDLGPKQAAVRELAARVGAVFVPLAAPLAALAERIGPEAVAADGVHPTAAGHTEIARLWWAAVSGPKTSHPAG